MRRFATAMLGNVAIALAGCLALAPGAGAATGEPPSDRAVTPNDFDGTDVERINRAIEVAAASGRRVVIPRVNTGNGANRDLWRIDSAILLRENTTLELENCRIQLSDRCRDNMMRSANCGMGITDIRPLQNIHIRGIGRPVLLGADHPRATGDSGKTLGLKTFGTDAGVAGESQTGDWRNIGILLAFVENFSIQNLAIEDSHCWAISLERCAQGTLRDLHFQSGQIREIDGKPQTILNQDGIDLRMGCHDILIENVTGHTGDDLIALTAIPNPASPPGATGSTMVSGAQDRGEGRDDIRHVILRNIRGHCAGGHHIVRLLNTSGVQLYDVLLDGLIDTSPETLRCKAAVKIGDRAYGGGIAPLGDTRGILIHGVISRAQHTILIGGSLSDSLFTNILRHGAPGNPVTIASGPEYVRNVTIANTLVSQDQAPPAPPASFKTPFQNGDRLRVREVPVPVLKQPEFSSLFPL